MMNATASGALDSNPNTKWALRAACLLFAVSVPISQSGTHV
jgi:hypothetical protein